MSKQPWHRLPTLCALLKLNEFRQALREKNLHDTSQIPDSEKLPHPIPDPSGRHLTTRTFDGSFNDLKHPEMGMLGTRFGRNVPLPDAYPDRDRLMTPNPRVISRTLMTRDQFIPATTLNLLAASWIQFQNHDWFDHAKHPSKRFEIPLTPEDPWPAEHRPMTVAQTDEDASRLPGDHAAPPTYISKSTHWWDGSQIYGNDLDSADKLRSHIDGKLTIGADGLLPFDEATGLDQTGFNQNWWFGLAVLHNLFVREHNHLCDQLKRQYPDWQDEDLYHHARLINAALMAKIHTVEWTPGILSHPALQIAMNANWYGLLGKQVKRWFGRIGDGELLSGIIGSPTDHHTAPYYLTEEFVSVYRLHPLIPDEFNLYGLENGKLIMQPDFFQASGKRTRAIMAAIPLSDLFYSLGIAHPGAITLHNYPRFLQQLIKDDGEALDLAAIDILRDRERGVPRYNRFRELIGRGRVKTFEDITSNAVWAEEMRQVYNNDIDSVDLMVGMFAEDLPKGFGFSDTAFRVFILMASRRLKSDRFFTKDYRAEVYTQFGLKWIDHNSMLTVLQRHFPNLKSAHKNLKNAFAPWRRVSG